MSVVLVFILCQHARSSFYGKSDADLSQCVLSKIFRSALSWWPCLPMRVAALVGVVIAPIPHLAADAASSTLQCCRGSTSRSRATANYSRWFLQQTPLAGDFCATCVVQFAANVNPFQDQHEDLDDLAVAERELP